MSARAWAVVDGSSVTNTIWADDDFIPLISPDHTSVVDVSTLVDGDQPSIGWTYDGTNFSPPAVV